ncbi:zinc-dependent metalloprotease [Winogradskyella psychrotolerans]|uniref:zinc-dependent metalloprotease n=1 Tax=Winogradskyella psychrotolerans TaxID=1344585 RepID=UPI001C067A7D|nr:zinc-dependent metalloprotease [Winogradskyella psychrotolerans]MBU2919913.1 zinc-dependent metalloprotease [Winogradskyella psychrotolerans]
MKITTFRFFCLSFLILLTTNISFAQQAEKCGTDQILEIERQKNPIRYDLNRAQIEAFTLNYRQNAAARSTQNTVTIIPTIVHIMHNGEAIGTYPNISEVQILSAISNLNDAFKNQGIYNGTAFYNNPMDIEFVLAKVKEDGTSTTGIERHDVTGKSYASLYSSDGISGGVSGVAPEVLFKDYIWNPQDYMNIWIVNKIDGVDIGTDGVGTLGYATLPGSNPGVTDGLVCQARAFGYEPTYDPNNPSATPGFDFGTGSTNASGNGTADHEVGHYLNLLHTFTGDNDETTCPPVSGTVGIDDDGCPDIPPHIRTNSICPADNPTGNSCTGGSNEYIHNFMDYSSDPCFTGFSNDQRTRVNATIDGPRSAFKTSLGHIAPSGTYPATVTNTPHVQNDYNDGMGVYEITLNGTTYTSVSGYHDGRYINRVASQPATTLASNTAYTMTIKVGVGNVNDNELVDVYIDYNNDGTFTTSERVYQTAGGDGKKNGDVFSFSFTTPTTGNFVDNQKLRMRVISGYDNSNDTLSSAYISDYGNIEDYSVIFNPKLTYTFDNNTWLPDNPIGVATVNDDIVINTGTANISANTSCANLIVNPGAALTVDSGVTVTTTTVNLNSTSQRFSSLISDGTITGTINYNRYVSQVAPTGTNDLVSSPVDGQMFGAFATANSNLATSGTLSAFAPYNTSAGVYQNYDSSTNASTLINAGTGYRVGTTDGSTLTFTGNVRTTNVLDIPLSNAVAGSAWNLIGNPYPSYIDFDTFFNTNKTEFDSSSAYQAIYGYDGNASNGWTVWNLATIADGTITELIAPGQAFFVKSKSTGGYVDFNTDMRRTGNSDDFIVGRSNYSNVALCKLNLNNAANLTSTRIYFIENTTRGLDVGYDAGSYMESASEFSIFSNLVEDNTGLSLAIQTLPYDDFNDVIVPLGVKAQANETLTISIDDISTLPEGINVYLEDSTENTFTLLNDNGYSFTSSTDINETGRFYLRYSSSVLSTTKNELDSLQIYASIHPKELVVFGQLNEKTKANIYDIQGRLMLNSNLDPLSTTNHIDVSTLSTGIYIVKIWSDNLVKTQKVIIK